MPYKDPEEHGVAEIYDLDASGESVPTAKEQARDKAARQKQYAPKEKKVERIDDGITILTKVFMLVAILLHIATAVRAFTWLKDDPLECCGMQPHYSEHIKILPLCYLVLLLIDVLLWVMGMIRTYPCGSWECGVGCVKRTDQTEEDDQGDTDDIKEEEKYPDPRVNDNIYNDNDVEDTAPKDKVSVYFRILLWIVVLNPFLAAPVILTAVYRSKSNSWFLWLLEAAAGLTWVLVLCGVKRPMGWNNFCMYIVRFVMPFLPLLVVAYALWSVLQEHGGVCFDVQNEEWNVGDDAACYVCADGFPPKDGDEGLCVTGAKPDQGTFCGSTIESQYCYFTY